MRKAWYLYVEGVFGKIKMADLTDIIQQIKRANDIVDVIGSYLELRQKGTTHWARCPFHGEKTASFCVNRNLQIYKCFGCGVSGDVVKFVQEYESLTFMEALEKLAKRANIKMPETSTQRQDKDYAERKRKQDVYLNILRETAVFYYKSYYSPRGETARKYVESRGFDADTVKKFGIGYSPDMESLVSYLLSKGFNTEDCCACGVLQRKNADGTLFDALYRRLIIPIFNMQGKVIAFGGRGITEDVINYGKYKNTAETPIFSKQNNLFAINIAKEQKQQAALPNIVVVEGYMDVIAMYQAGFKRAVASMGTSLTEKQAKWLSRLTSTVYICYDGDAAGQKATVRGMDILDKAGLEVRVMSVPEKLDPDEYIKKYGAEAFEKIIEQALPLPDYKLKLLDDTFDIRSADAAKRNDALQKYVKGALVMLKQLDDVRQAQYVAEVSRRTSFSQEYILRKLADNGAPDDEQSSNEVTQFSPEDQAKFFIAACVLNNESYAHITEKPICDTLFLSDLYNYIFDAYAQGDKPSMDMLYTVCPNARQEEYDLIIGVDLSAARKRQNKQYFEECVQLITNEKLLRTRKQLRDKLDGLSADSDEYFKILGEIAEISDKIKRN